MIVVVGTPAWRAAEPSGPAGRAGDIAMAAARAGAPVELAGRVGDDGAGDSLLLALAAARVGHVAVLRDPVRPTPVLAPLEAVDDLAGVTGDEAVDAGADGRTRDATGQDGPTLEPADVSLALQYLTDFAVLVVTDDVPPGVLPVAVEAASFAGAQLVLLLPAGQAAPDGVPASTTVLAAPDAADDGAFARLVGTYAAGLDGGMAPADAFSRAAGSTGWEVLDPAS